MKYDYMVTPFEKVSFIEMNKDEAKEYFDWYMGQRYIRLFILHEAIRREGVNIDFDYSPESLISLWAWYETKIMYRKIRKEEYQEELNQYPNWLKSSISNLDIAYETWKYGMDLAIYFAEAVVRNSDGKIEWGYFTKPKNRASVNEPVLLGFKNGMDLNPRRIVAVCTRRSGKDKKPSRLFEIYNVWMGDVE